jgi:hypothetical protein
MVTQLVVLASQNGEVEMAMYWRVVTSLDSTYSKLHSTKVET